MLHCNVCIRDLQICMKIHYDVWMRTQVLHGQSPATGATRDTYTSESLSTTGHSVRVNMHWPRAK